MRIKVYTDGACSGNPGFGGWAYEAITAKGKKIYKSGGSKNVTNNRMELKAIVKAISYLLEKFPNKKLYIEIYSDSAYCINSVKLKWVNFWQQNGWKTKKNEEVKNQDLWKEMMKFLTNPSLVITFVKVKGHSGDSHNELVDLLAKSAAKKVKEK